MNGRWSLKEGRLLYYAIGSLQLTFCEKPFISFNVTKLFFPFLLLSCFISASCSLSSTTSSAITDSPEGLYSEALKMKKKKLYIKAKPLLVDFKSRYPHHSLISNVDLTLSDIHYDEGNYPEAQYAYKLFRSLYPKHVQQDYADFKCAMSQYRQVPKVAQRDLSGAVLAVKAFRKLIRDYPKSPYVEDSKNIFFSF